jgi:hypothetical protein
VYARAIDEASTRLRELRQEERWELALAGAALAASLAATQVLPELAAPLFIGALVIGARGACALWRRWDLVERLSGERDAHVITEVRAFALREATMERRRCCAGHLRAMLREARLAGDARLLAVADELEELATALEDDGLTLEPACAVACVRLLSDVTQSPLLNRALPSEDLRSRVRQIRSGFSAQPLAPATDHPVQDRLDERVGVVLGQLGNAQWEQHAGERRTD